MPDPSDKSRPWKHWAPSEWKAGFEEGRMIECDMVILGWYLRRSLEGAKDPSILCAAPGEKNLKMLSKTRKTFVKQMCNPHDSMMFSS